MNYGVIGWTPELDTCATGGEPGGLQPVRLPGRRGEGPGGLQQEPAVGAQRRALGWPSSTARGTSTTTRRSTRSRPPRTSSRTASTSPTARTQQIEANVPQDARPGRRHGRVVGPGGTSRTVTAIRAQDVPPRRALRRGSGLRTSSACGSTIPANFASAPRRAAASAGDIVNVDRAAPAACSSEFSLPRRGGATTPASRRSACWWSPPRTTRALAEPRRPATTPRRATSRSTSPR